MKRFRVLAIVLTVIVLLGLVQVASAASPIYVRPGGDDTNCNGTADVDYPGGAGPLACAVKTIQKGVDLVDAGGTVVVRSGTYVLSAVVNVDKAGITLDGDGAGATIVQVSGTGDRLNLAASGVTLQDFEIVKTDKTGEQNIIRVSSGDGVSIKNNTIHGQFVIGDGEVSRAIVVNAGAMTGLNIEGNTFYALRQPAYVSGTHAGTVKNNYTYGTKGWVLEGGNLAFTGNTWGTGANVNVYDVAILSAMPAAYYTDIVAMSNANNGAVIEDQRVSPAVLSVVYVDASTSYTSDQGGLYHPYSTIAPAITRVVAGGTIHVAAGTYAGNVTINKPLTLHSLSGAATTTITGSSGTAVTISANGVTVDGFTITNPAGKSGIYAQDRSYLVIKNNIITGIGATDATTSGTNYGLAVVSSAAAVDTILVLNNQFSYIAGGNFKSANGIAVGWSNGDLDITNLTVQHNTISHITSSVLEYASGGRGAYGVILNHAVGGTGKLGKTVSPQILNNTISDLEGLWAHGIGLEGNTPNALVQGNNISSLTDHKTPSDAVAVQVEDNASASTLTITGNKLTNANIGVQNTVAGQTVKAESNYWGTTVFSEIVPKISGAVDWSPWCNADFTTCTYAWPVHNVTQGTDYQTIQAAVTAANANDVIQAASGTYIEQVTVNKSLHIEGAGEATTTIVAPATRTGSVTQGTDVHDYLLAAYASSGTIDVRVEGFTFDLNAQNKTAGTARLDGVFFRDIKDAGGAMAGLFSSTMHNFAATPDYEGWGIAVFGDSLLTLNDNDIHDYTRDGILAIGGNLTISNNTVTGSATPLYGINVQELTAGSVTGNTVTGHTRSAPWAAVGIGAWHVSGLTITGNHVNGNFYGIDLAGGSDGNTVSSNVLTNNIKRGISLDNSDNNTVSGNTVTGPAAGTDDVGIAMVNTSTGNTIGGATAADGNTIVMATAGTANLYAIHLQSDVGAGSNTIRYNSITGGKRAVQLDGPPGVTGLTTIANNTISGQEFGGITAYNNGSLIITDNTLTNAVRPMEFFGPVNLTITGNHINGSTYFGINLGVYSGSATISGNTIHAIASDQNGIWAQTSGAGLNITGNTIYDITGSGGGGGRAIQIDASADGANIDGNEVYNITGYAGIVVDTGATAVKINNNYVHDNLQGISVNEATAEFNRNRVLDNRWGIDVNSMVAATFVMRYNQIAGNDSETDSYGLTAYNVATADAARNWWGAVSGPGLVAAGSGDKISTNVLYVPWCTNPECTTFGAPVINTTRGTYFATLQPAIDDAATANGDVITVAPGTYTENVTVNKSVTITGAAGAILDGGGTGTVVDITAAGVTLQGFIIQHSGVTATDAGVKLSNVTGSTVKLSTVTANANGILVVQGSGNFVTSNAVNGNGGYGVALVASTGNTVNLNTISGNGADAIALENANVVGGPITLASTGNFIKGNTLSSARDAIFLGENCDNNQVTDGNQISSAAGIGISSWRSDGHTVTDNIISGAATGIRFLGSSNNTISRNKITGNAIGLKVDASWQVGVWYQSDNNAISNNDLSANTAAVTLGAEQTAVVNASGNWWGVATPAGVAALVSADVDYTPWLAGGTDTGDPGFQGDFATLWVDDDSAQTGATGRIQEGINLVTAGGTVNVAAGTYADDPVIGKPLSLRGPNAGIDPNTGTRVAEAILIPAYSYPDPDVCELNVWLGDPSYSPMDLTNVTIDGFTVDGDNPELTSGVIIDGADVDGCVLIGGWIGTYSNITIKNNILKHSTYAGIDLANMPSWTPTSGNSITHNRFEDIGETTFNNGIGVITHYNFNADITYNVMTGVRLGIQTENINAASPGAPNTISNNTIGAWRLGVFHNTRSGTATAYTLANNTVTAESYPGITDKWNGILLSVHQGTADTVVSSNNITIPDTLPYSEYSAGYNVWSTASGLITIEGGTITGGTYGIFVNNWEGYSPTPDTSLPTSVAMDGVTILGSDGAGVYVKDNPSNTHPAATVYANIQNSMIETDGIGVLVDGADASALIESNSIINNVTGIQVQNAGTVSPLSGNSIAGNTNLGVNNTTAATVVATGNWWGHPTGCGPVGGTGYGDHVSTLVTCSSPLTSSPTGVAAIGFDPNTCAVARSGASAVMTIKMYDVVDMLGYQFKVHYADGSVGAAGAFVNSWFNTVGGWIAGETDPWDGSCSAGVCKFGVTKLDKAGVVNGSGPVATVTLTGLPAAPFGTFGLAFSEVLIADSDGMPQPVALSTATCAVYDVATVNGTVTMQGRLTPKSAGTVTLADQSGFLPAVVAPFSATDGTFTAQVPWLPTSTTYDITASHTLYLSNKYVGYSIDSAGPFVLPSTKLLGGDAVMDGLKKIAINDLSCIGGQFGHAPELGACTGLPNSPDINEDGTVNILDLVLAGGNYGLTTPQLSW